MDEKKEEQKQIVLVRAVSIEEMLNHINDKMDFMIQKLMERK